MSLVGPRPQREGEVALYDAAASRRLLLKPGMSGLWQVGGRSSLGWEDAIRLDLYYVENWSLTGDMVILWRHRACRSLARERGVMTTSGALGQQRRTLIVEPNVHGHRLFYVRLLIDAARRRGDLVFVGTRLDVLTTAEGSEHLGGQEGWTLVEATSTELRTVERLSVS